MKNTEVIPDLKGRKFNGHLSKSNASAPSRVSGSGNYCVHSSRSTCHAKGRGSNSIPLTNRGRRVARFPF